MPANLSVNRLNVLIEYFQKTLNLPYFILINLLGILVLIAFLALPKEKKKKPEFLLAFVFVILLTFYENFAYYLIVDKKLNEFFHGLITDTPFQGWNLWVFNLFNDQLSKILLLMVILVNVYGKTRRLALKITILLFCLSCLFLQLLGIEPLYSFQTIIYLIGNSALIVACGLYFVDLLSHEKHLDTNPLKSWSFWSITLILFESTVVFLADIAYSYLAFNNVELYNFFNLISQVLYVLLIMVMVFTIVSEIFLEFFKAKLSHDT